MKRAAVGCKTLASLEVPERDDSPDFRRPTTTWSREMNRGHEGGPTLSTTTSAAGEPEDTPPSGSTGSSGNPNPFGTPPSMPPATLLLQLEVSDVVS